MYNKKQIKAIIDTLKDKSIDGRPPLQQVFEQGGYLWATNGYVAFELGEVKDELKGKRITLERLVGWYGTHKTNDTTTLTELLEGKEYKVEYDGCKMLAYTIMGHEKAHYIYVDITLTPLEVSLLPEKLEKLDWCLRYLLVTKNTRAEKIKGIIKSYIIDTLGWEELDKTKLDIEGLAYKIDWKLGDNND